MTKASAHDVASCSVESHRPRIPGFLTRMPASIDANQPPPDGAGDPIDTAARFAALAHDRQPLHADDTRELAQALTADAEPRVYVAALGALVRGGAPTLSHRAWTAATIHTVPGIRRRAAELSPQLESPSAAPLIALVSDADDLVAEAACWASGEVPWSDPDRAGIVAAIVLATGHGDPLVREAAVAALGAIGDPAGLDAILTACGDRPTVRRRAVLALAPFDGARVEEALRAALEDSDWQTRQAAEDLLGPTNE